MEEVKKEWCNIEVYTKNVVMSNDKAVLINMPFRGDYVGYKFWIPAKLYHAGRNKNIASIGFTGDFKFNIFKEEKNDEGKYVKVDEKELSAGDMANAFKEMDEAIKAYRADKKASKAAE